MKDTKKRLPNFSVKATGCFFLLLTAVIVFAFCMPGRNHDLNETYALAQETESFLETTCQKYENYDEGNSSKSLQHLLDIAMGLEQFIAPSKVADSEFLFRFIRAEHLGGIVLVDSSMSPVSQADMDNADSYSMWKTTLYTQPVQDILAHPEKTYSDSETIDGKPYHFSVISYGDGLLLCYELTEKPATDPYEFNFDDILSNDTFKKNPTAIITEGDQVLSTNDSTVKEAVSKQEGFSEPSINWNENSLTSFEYDGGMWYGLRSVYENYNIYLIYPSSEVFSSTLDIISFGLLAWFAICVAILIVRAYFYKRNLRTTQKQLSIISAISATYASTFLLHLDKVELEPIKLSDEVNAIYEKSPEPHQFLSNLCNDILAPESIDAVRELMEEHSIASRLAGNPFIACELKTKDDIWYSLQLIPQHYSENGTLQTILVASRNIMTPKKAEALSYYDKLTGLRNRNYYESHLTEFSDADGYPLSVIMADCNFLKRTNDALGHKWGDELLRRVGEALKNAVPKECTVMRIGGDEFLIVCPKTTKDQAEGIIEDIKHAMKERSDEQLTLSASLGYSTALSSSTPFEQIHKQADEAMYEEKTRFHAERGNR